MVNRKGYIKTLEAVIAIILVIAISYILIPQHTEIPPEPPLIVRDAMRFINQEIELDENLRKDIVTGNAEAKGEVEEIIKKNKPTLYEFTCAICANTDKCFINPLSVFRKNIYVNDVLISSSGKEQNLKIVRIWSWKGPAKEEDLPGYDFTTFENRYLNRCEQI